MPSIPDYVSKWAVRIAVLAVVLMIIAAGYSYLEAATGLLPGGGER
jgi:hypothetical protein